MNDISKAVVMVARKKSETLLKSETEPDSKSNPSNCVIYGASVYLGNLFRKSILLTCSLMKTQRQLQCKSYQDKCGCTAL